METMILVAGLAIAGLAGIAAAFYFSVRPGNSGNERNSRVRVGGSGRTGADRSPVGRGRTPIPRSRSGQAGGRPDPDSDLSAPPRRADLGHLAVGHRVHRDGSAGQRADHPAPAGRRVASAGVRPGRAESPGFQDEAPEEAAEATRSRRRVGWRKGSEVDEELWPVAAFGGVSDEQFWDDMASDKPLATTARAAAQPEPGSRRRLPDVVPVPDRRDGDVSRGSRPAPADRTGAQPVQAGPAAVQGSTQPTPVATRSYQSATQSATQPAPIAGQGARAGLPADPRGRARIASGTGAAGEDPLTSAAYALRAPGAVDGRSYLSPYRSRDPYETAITQETQGFSLAEAQSATGGYPARPFELPAGGGNGRAPEPRPDAVRSDPARWSDPYGYGGRPDPLRGPDPYGSTGGHPYPERPYGDQAQPVSAPQYGDIYGYGYPVSPADDPRQPNGTRGQGRSAGTGGWAARQAYPAGSGHRSPYDPRANGRG
jgi:hypothetical protein